MRSARSQPRCAPAETTRAPGPVAGLLLISAVLLGCALQVNFGQYHPLALLWLTAALLACAAGALARSNGTSSILLGPRGALPIAAGCLAVQFALLLSRNPTATMPVGGGWRDLLPFTAGTAAAAGLVALSLSRRERLRRVAVPLLLLTHLLLGAWVIRHTPRPGVDVYVFQHDACRALLRGENPYAITFPDLYGTPADQAPAVYAPGVSVDGRLQFGYPYPPLPLLLALPGHLAGDFRYAQLLATTLAGALMMSARPGRLATLAAAMFLFTPRGFFVLEAGWTEPFVALCLAAVTFVACRTTTPPCKAADGIRGSSPGLGTILALPLALGLLLAVKQYTVLALPLAFVCLAGARRKGRWRLLVPAGAVALAVSLPLALWDPGAFWHSVVALQFHQPFRPDALSYLVPLSGAFGPTPPAWPGFLAALVALALALWKCPRTPAGFAAGVALVFFAFFAFNKQAFCNYYHFVLAALCCAAAACDRGTGEPRPPARDPGRRLATMAA